MLTRKRYKSKPNLEEYKAGLKRLGWSYRAVAPYLGVHYVHLSLVLNGKRESNALSCRISQLIQKQQKPTDQKP